MGEKVSDKIDEIKELILDFLDAHKYIIQMIIVILIGLVIIAVAWKLLYNPVKVVFEGEDSEVIGTQATSLEIKATALDKKGNKYEIKWTTTGGKVDKEIGDEVIWTLPEEKGTYNLIATVGEKQFVKKVSVVENVMLNNLVVANYIQKDTDLDGLTDEYENTKSKTDINKKDTDSDGLYDGNEVVLGLDPNMESTKSDSILDFERKSNYTLNDSENDVNIDLNGTGNIVNTTVDKYTTKSIQELKQVVSDNYNIYSEGNIETAKISIRYNKEYILASGIDENNLSIYKLIDSNNNFEKIGTTVDLDKNTVSCDVKELGKFFIADSSQMIEKRKTELMFIIDNSGSMYSSKEIEESASNDPEFKRVELSNNLIDKLNGDYKFAASKFTFDSTILSSFTDNKEEIKNKINTIKTDTEKFTGTYIGNALNSGVDEFPKEESMDRRYIILLTDGKDTTNVNGYNKDKIKEAIKNAAAKQIKVFTIGLGLDIDKEFLNNISTQTGGKFYYTSSAEMLDNIFGMIASEINYNFIDTDKNGADENIILRDTNFTTMQDGFDFENFASKQNLNGTSYGMALFTKLYYEKSLPKNLSKMTITKRDKSGSVTATGYDVGSSFGGESDLIEYKFNTLKFLNENTKKIRGNEVIEKVLPFKAETSTALQTAGFIIYNQEYNIKESKFKYFENYYVDLESELYLKNDKRDIETINALNRLDILKYKDEEISFVEKPDTAYAKLLNYLALDKPVLLKINDNYTLLATRVSFNSKDPNNIKIEVYDNNFKTKVKYIEVERIVVNEKNENSKNDKYNYKFKYNGLDVNIKLSIPNIDANL